MRVVMPQLIKPSTKVKIIPKDGEIEITLNININLEGKVSAVADNAEVLVDDEEKVPHIIPDFSSGLKLNFGKNA
jgi:hypothetical protein